MCPPQKFASPAPKSSVGEASDALICDESTKLFLPNEILGRIGSFLAGDKRDLINFAKVSTATAHLIKPDLYRILTVDPALPAGAPRGILGDEPAIGHEEIVKYTDHLTLLAHHRDHCSLDGKRHYWDDEERTNLKTIRLHLLESRPDGKLVCHDHPSYCPPSWLEDEVPSFCPLVNKFTFEKFTVYGSTYKQPFTLNQELPDNCHTVVSVMTPHGHHSRNVYPRRHTASGSLAKSKVKRLVIVAWTDKSSDDFVPYYPNGGIPEYWTVNFFQRVIELLGFLGTDVTVTIVGLERTHRECFGMRPNMPVSEIHRFLLGDLDYAGTAHNNGLLENWDNYQDPNSRWFTNERYYNFKFLSLKEYLDDSRGWKGVLTPEQVETHLAT